MYNFNGDIYVFEIGIKIWKPVFHFLSLYLGVLEVGHEAEVEEAGERLLQALQPHQEGFALHHQVKQDSPKQASA
jgi:hypothetical protein